MLTEKVENIFWLYMQKLEEEFLKVALNKTRDQKTKGTKIQIFMI